MSGERESLIVGTMLLTMLLPKVAVAYYSPRHGRWLSRDPIGEQGGRLPLSLSRSPSPMRQATPADLVGFGMANRIESALSGQFREMQCVLSASLENPGVREYQHNYFPWHKGLLLSNGADIDFGPVSGQPIATVGVCPYSRNPYPTAANTKDF
jgi:hypothetical protein